MPLCPCCERITTKPDSGGLVHCFACALSFAAHRETTVCYDQAYVAKRYDRYPTTEQMSALRRNVFEHVLYIEEAISCDRRFGFQRGSLLDVGFGNGSFIRHARECGWDAFGYDVNPTEYEGVRRKTLEEALAAEWRVMSFFDSLEHFAELIAARRLASRAEWLVVSVPLPPLNFVKEPTAWKHLRPGEHHWHFRQPWTLARVFSGDTTSARVVYASYPEDSIRGKLPDGQPNILTCVLKVERKDA